MALTDTFTAIPDQFLEMLGVTQQIILTGASALVSTAKSLTPTAGGVPFADRMPDPVKVADGIFAFSEKVLASQRDFSCKLLETYQPAKSSSAGKTSGAKAA